MAITWNSRNQRMEVVANSNAGVDDLLANGSDKTDGWLWCGADRITDISASTKTVLTRNAAGDYSQNTTAGGAETHTMAASFAIPARTTAGRGYKITDVLCVYALGVADATSVSGIVLNQITFADRVAVSVAAHGGTVTLDTNHDSAGERITFSAGTNPHVMKGTLGTPIFQVNDLVVINTEVVFVLQNTGTMAFYGFGLHYTYNYL